MADSPLLFVRRPAVTHPATVLDALRVVVGPVDQPAQVVPLVHSAYPDAVTDAKRYAFGEINIVRNQQRLPIADVDDESLMGRAVVIVMQKAPDEATDFDPPPVIALVEPDASLPLPGPS
jgi:hypothetical protein